MRHRQDEDDAGSLARRTDRECGRSARLCTRAETGKHTRGRTSHDSAPAAPPTLDHNGISLP